MFRSSRTVFRMAAAVGLLGWHWWPSAWNSAGLDRIQWALACDEVEKLDRLLCRIDGDHTDHGYYNQLLDTGLHADRPPSIAIAVDELRELVLRPNLSIVRSDGTTWTANDLGLRDRFYPREKPPSTIRIAMTGDSIGVGLGVGDGKGFEPLLERSLNERSRRRGGPSIEILNFALPGRSPGQRWDHFRKTGWATQPDLVLFEATPADDNWDRRRLSEILPRGIGWDSSIYGDVLERSGLRPGGTAEVYWEALAPYRWDLLAAAYRTVAAECRARGVPCVWVLIPRVGRFVSEERIRKLVHEARAAGFTAVVDVSDAFDGRDPAELAVHPSDFHPNAEGHAILSRRIARELRALPALQGPATPDRTPSDQRTTEAPESDRFGEKLDVSGITPKATT